MILLSPVPRKLTWSTLKWGDINMKQEDTQSVVSSTASESRKVVVPLEVLYKIFINIY